MARERLVRNNLDRNDASGLILEGLSASCRNVMCMLNFIATACMKQCLSQTDSML